MDQQTDWELSKENVRLLKKGRNVEKLNEALKIDKEDQFARERQIIKQFEERLSESGEDPLHVWCLYIKWIEENLPQGGGKKLSRILQDCIFKFLEVPSYHNDERYLEIWIKHIQESDNALELYEYLHSNFIGNSLASLYIAWSLEYENAGKMKAANEVFVKGIDVKAEPFNVLKNCYREFINRAKNKKPGDSSPNSEKRVALGALKPHGLKQKVSSVRQYVKENSNGEPKIQKSGRKVLAPTVYEDPESPKKTAPVNPEEYNNIPAANPKENFAKPSKWNKAKINVSKPPVKQNDIQIFEDEENNENKLVNKTPCKLPEYSSVLSCKKAEPDNILEKIKDKDQGQLKEKLMYCKERLFGGFEELQFEEVRAKRWLAKQKTKQKREEEMNQLRLYCQNMIQEMMPKLLSMSGQQLTCNFEQIQKQGNLPASVMQDLVSNVLDAKRKSLCEQKHQPQQQTLDEEPMQCEAYGGGSDRLMATPNKAEDEQMQWETKEATSKHLDMSVRKSVALSDTNRLVENEIRQIDQIRKSMHFEANCQQQLTESEDSTNLRNLISNVVQAKRQSPEQFATSKNNISSQRLLLVDSASDIKNKPAEPAINVDTVDNVMFDMWNRSLFVSEQLSLKSPINGIDAEELELRRQFADSGAASKTGNKFELYEDSLNGQIKENPSQPLQQFEIFDDGINSKETSRRPSEKFSIFKDNSTSFENKKAEEIRNLNPENIENIPPSGYVQPENCRPITGILEPSWGIPSLPLDQQDQYEDQFDVSMEDDELVDDNEIGKSFTVIPGENIFAANLKIKSTPFNFNGFTESSKIEINPDEQSKITNQNHPEILTAVPNRSQTTATTTPTVNLSTIREASCEFSSKSSSGSTGSSGCTTKSQKLFSGIKSQIETLTITEKSELELSHQQSCLIKEEEAKINPFDEVLIAKLLFGLEHPITARTGFIGSDSMMPNFAVKSNVTLADKETYYIKNNFACGAYAKVYLAMSKSNESHVVLKRQKPPCPWEFYIVTELSSRLKALQHPYNVFSSIMNIQKAYIYSNESLLVSEYMPLGTILDVINVYTKQNQSMPENIIMYFTVELLHILEQMHACRIIHADVKPDNVLVRNIPQINNYVTTPEEIFGNTAQCLQLIDFGRAIDLKLMPSGTTFIQKVLTDGFECVEMKENRPWTYQTDLYGLAAIIHCMLFGTYMEVIIMKENRNCIVKSFRRWHSKVWESVFDTLLNIPDCDNIPDLCKLRELIQRDFIQYKKHRDFNDKVRQLNGMLGVNKNV